MESPHNYQLRSNVDGKVWFISLNISFLLNARKIILGYPSHHLQLDFWLKISGPDEP